MVCDERADVGMGDDAIEKEFRADESDVGNTDCIGEPRDRRKKLIIEMCGLLGMFESLQGNSMGQ